MNRMGRYEKEDGFPWKPGVFEPDPGISTEELICSFEKFLKQDRDIEIVKKVAFEADLVPKNFYADGHVELGFDLYFLDEGVCQIYKTWNDPGFRLARDVLLTKETAFLKSKIIKISVLCNANFVRAVTMRGPEGQVVLELEIGIFYGGINEKVLRAAVEVLEFIDEKVKQIVEDRQV